MPSGPNNSVGMLSEIQKNLQNASGQVQQATPVDEAGNPIDPNNKDAIFAYWKRLQEMGVNVEQMGQAIEDTGVKQEDSARNMQGVMPSVAKRQYFDLIKTAQMSTPPMSQTPQTETEPSLGIQDDAPDPFAEKFSLNNVEFADADSVKEALITAGNVEVAIQAFKDRFTNQNSTITDPNNQDRTGDSQTAMEEAIKDFYQARDKKDQDEAARFIFDTFIRKDDEDTTVPTNMKNNIHPTVASLVKETNDLIRKAAEEHANKKKYSGSFNLSKEAQHKGVENNVIMYGPEDKVYDVFTRQPISKWHLVERNKGFGLRVDDVLDIDFESVWRGTVMDKYSQPWRDKDGNWVGGYIQDRFEVDKHIPETSNYQLKPGERRKPTLPEYGNIGSRLEATRTEMNKERGYEPSEKGKVFNWAKEASTKIAGSVCECCGNAMMISGKLCPSCIQEDDDKKKVKSNSSFNLSKEADLNPIKPLTGIKPLTAPGEKIKQPSAKCPHCGKDVAIGTGAAGGREMICSCGTNLTNPNLNPPKLGPDPRKTKRQQILQKQTPSIQPNTQIASSLNKEIQSFGGIFFDGNKFVCYAKKKKHEFDEYEEAEKFFNTSTMNPIIEGGGMGVADPNVWNQQQQNQPGVNSVDVVDEVDLPIDPSRPLHPKKKDIHNSANGLAL